MKGQQASFNPSPRGLQQETTSGESSAAVVTQPPATAHTTTRKASHMPITSFPGEAGQPRATALWRPKPGTPLSPRARNTKRGLRSEAGKAQRNQKRTCKRRLARRQDRREKQQGKGTHSQNRCHATRAKAQHPGRPQKLAQHTTYNLATLNIRGTNKPGTREEIEKWMERNDVDILVLQDTKSKHNSREARKQYTWYFSSENPTNPNYTTGVGTVIRNKLVKHITHIEPINDRLMFLVLNHTMPVTIINTYMPQAMRPLEEKQHMYEQVEELITKYENVGPVLIGGDFNAKLHKPNDEDEAKHIGRHTFQCREPNPHMSEETQENRQLLVDLCKTKEIIIICNTQFAKQESQKTTFLKPGHAQSQNPTRDSHAQIDYWLIAHRWKNMVKDAEADPQANIDTDHYPAR